MLSLEEIKKNTIWVLKHDSGYRETGTYDELKKKADECDDFRDFDTVNAAGQPKELQAFWKAYEYANYVLREDLFLVDDFYAEWSKNPDRFKAEMRPVKCMLSDVLDGCKYENVVIENYDHRGVGNHLVRTWLEALSTIDSDFDVVDYEEYTGNTLRIIIQTTDMDKLIEFDSCANRCAW